MKRIDFGGLLNVLGLAAIALALFVFLPATCEADTADVSWLNATQYTDGTAIPSGGITATEIQYGICDANRTGFAVPAAAITVSVAFPGTSRQILGIGNGTWCFRARHAAPNSVFSAYTAMVTKTVVLVPATPQTFTVTLSL